MPANKKIEVLGGKWVMSSGWQDHVIRGDQEAYPEMATLPMVPTSVSAPRHQVADPTSIPKASSEGLLRPLTRESLKSATSTYPGPSPPSWAMVSPSSESPIAIDLGTAPLAYSSSISDRSPEAPSPRWKHSSYPRNPLLPNRGAGIRRIQPSTTQIGILHEEENSTEIYGISSPATATSPSPHPIYTRQINDRRDFFLSQNFSPGIISLGNPLSLHHYYSTASPPDLSIGGPLPEAPTQVFLQDSPERNIFHPFDCQGTGAESPTMQHPMPIASIRRLEPPEPSSLAS